MSPYNMPQNFESQNGFNGNQNNFNLNHRSSVSYTSFGNTFPVSSVNNGMSVNGNAKKDPLEDLFG